MGSVDAIGLVIAVIPFVFILLLRNLPEKMQVLKTFFFYITLLSLTLNLGIAQQIVVEEVVDSTLDVLSPLFTTYWILFITVVVFTILYMIIVFIQGMGDKTKELSDEMRRRRT